MIAALRSRLAGLTGNAAPTSVFVLCTGRCGSVTFAQACGHIENWSAGHETRTGLLGADRLDYPDRHIEVDNRLSWFLGRLDKRYGTKPIYVHLTRDAEATARSFAKRQGGIFAAYGPPGILMRCREKDRLKLARDYVATVTANIEHFLADKPNRIDVKLETAERDFAALWDRIGARGDRDAALAQFSIRHNAS